LNLRLWIRRARVDICCNKYFRSCAITAICGCRYLVPAEIQRDERFASRFQEAVRIRTSDAQPDRVLAEPVIQPEPMSMRVSNLQSSVFWHIACRSRRGDILVAQDQTSLAGCRRERAASGFSFCLAATSQESRIHDRGNADAGSGHLRQRHGVQLD